MPLLHKNAGFTLIELSIVLTVISLIAGGILLGRELIRAAEIRSQIAQMEQYNVAVNTFKQKYLCLPGDCVNAVELGWGTQPYDNGNGDGTLRGNSTLILDNWEAVNFWHHLSQAKLIDGTFPLAPQSYIPGTHVPGIASPPLKMSGRGLKYGIPPALPYINPQGGLWIVHHDRYLYLVMPRTTHAWFLTATTAIQGSEVVYDAATAYAIDKKIDDAFPTTGQTQAVNGYYQTSLVLLGSGSDPITNTECVIDDGMQPPYYHITQDLSTNVTWLTLCSLIIATPF